MTRGADLLHIEGQKGLAADDKRDGMSMTGCGPSYKGWNTGCIL